jgi:hypothetical protein
MHSHHDDTHDLPHYHDGTHYSPPHDNPHHVYYFYSAHYFHLQAKTI